MDTRNPSRTMLDIPSRVRVHVETLLAAQNDMGVCDAIEQYAQNRRAGRRERPSRSRKWPESIQRFRARTHCRADDSVTGSATGSSSATSSTGPGAVLQDRADQLGVRPRHPPATHRAPGAHRDTERRAAGAAASGAALVGARRGLVVMEPGDRLGPDTTIGLGLARADLGHIETVPRSAMSYSRILDGLPGGEGEISQPDLLSEDGLDPRHREVAARLGYAASYALPLSTKAAGRLVAVWLYDEPAEPVERQRHLVGLYARYATEHLARLLELDRTRACMKTISQELLPPRLPGSPVSSSPPGTARARAEAATGTTRCRCPTPRSASRSAPSPGPGPARGRPPDGPAGPHCGRTP